MHSFPLIILSFVGFLEAYNSIFDLVDFGPLEYYNASHPIFSESAFIHEIQEDINQPGSFIFTYKYGLKGYSQSSGTSQLCGNDKERGYKDGAALDARFRVLYDFLQYNETKIAIIDFYNGCIREYDHRTDNVSTLIGYCKSQIGMERYDGEKSDIDSVVLPNPISLVYLKSTNQFLVSTVSHLIFKVDMTAGTIESFNIELVNVLFMLLNPDETLLYTTHFCGVSVVNIASLAAEVLIDKECYGNGQNKLRGKEPPLREGSFSKASLGFMSKPAWVIPDHILMAVTANEHESIVVIDLRKKYVNILCNGSKDQNETITGPPHKCMINSPVDVFISNDTAYITSVYQGERVNQTDFSDTSLMQVKLSVKRCAQSWTNGINILFPNREQYDIYSSYSVSCPDGYGLNSSYSTITCSEPENQKSKAVGKLQWDRPVPTCTDNLIIESIRPRSGQKSGGTLVTAVGVIPRSDLIKLYMYHPYANEIYFKIQENMVVFEMPPCNGADDEQVNLVFQLTDYEKTLRNFTFRYTYSENPKPFNQTLINIKSGGLDGVFCLDSIQSAYNYSINMTSETANSSKFATCRVEDSCVLCRLPECPLSDSETCFVALYGDKVDITRSQVKLLPDPIINISKTEIPISAKSVEVVLNGEFLDLGIANRFYRVHLENSSNSSVSCVPIIEKITNTTLPCKVPTSNILMNSDYLITVQIGNFDKASGYVVFINLQGDNNTDTIAYSVIIPIVVLLSIVVLVVCLQRRKKSYANQETELNYRLKISKELLAEVKLIAINPSRVKVSHDHQIGQGHFGVVFKGQLHSKEKMYRVAVKTVKEGEITGARLEDFLKEAVLLRKCHHINVLPVIGVCWSDECIPQVVLPYMANGDLKSVLRKPSLILTVGDLLHFGRQVACGMEYLSGKSFIHRDLAARNCLVSETYIVKISDFGLSRDLYNKDYYRLKDDSCSELPVKWMSIESLQSGLFTTSSDMWSFGVLLWEICTRGSDPYPDVNPHVMLRYLQDGNRLSQPSYSPDAIYDLMKRCWNRECKERPSFTEIHAFLRQLLEGCTLDPVSTYTYVRECTRDIPDDYIHGNYMDGCYEEIHIDEDNLKNQTFGRFSSCL